ncbi:hypothetical protein DKM18_22480 [Mycobacterium tuberculosis variant bovis]|nr:hypothetical protein DKM18_22480 [Mycobacterium tuberculosis variant bovis]
MKFITPSLLSCHPRPSHHDGGTRLPRSAPGASVDYSGAIARHLSTLANDGMSNRDIFGGFIEILSPTPTAGSGKPGVAVV